MTGGRDPHISIFLFLLDMWDPSFSLFFFLLPCFDPFSGFFLLPCLDPFTGARERVIGALLACAARRRAVRQTFKKETDFLFKNRNTKTQDSMS